MNAPNDAPTAPLRDGDASTDEAVKALSDELVVAICEHHPIDATLAGVRGYDGAWDDFSPDGAARSEAMLRGFRRRLDALPPAQSTWGRRAARVCSDHLADRLGVYENGDHFLELNSIESPFQRMRMVFDLMDTSTAEGLDAMGERLMTIDRGLDGYRALLREGVARDVVVAKRQVRAVIEQLRAQCVSPSPLRSLAEAALASPASTPARVARIEGGIAHAQEHFARLAGDLEDWYLPRATTREAVGADRYVRSARRFLGMSIDPHEAYAWGWEQVFEIERAMQGVASTVRPGSSVAEVVEAIKSDPAITAPSIEAFLQTMRDRQERALRELTTHFDIPDAVRRIEVKLAPAGGCLGAYYVPPSEDFSRPGTVWYSPGEQTRFPLFDEITTAYHEGFPGHHLQCALAVLMSDELTRLHRLFVCYSGYAEGWALYAEHLMFELGYLERPEFVLGMYAAKLVRALRVVADIGMHLELTVDSRDPSHPGERWTHEICVDMLANRGFIERAHAESEATRYLGWPGQAISYKLGERVILDLRDQLARRHGSDFRLREFHRRVLAAGSVGLDHLRELVLGDA